MLCALTKIRSLLFHPLCRGSFRYVFWIYLTYIRLEECLLYCYRQIIKSRISRPHIYGDFNIRAVCSSHSCVVFESELFFYLLYEKHVFSDSILTHTYQSALMHLTCKNSILYHSKLLEESSIQVLMFHKNLCVLC